MCVAVLFNKYVGFSASAEPLVSRLGLMLRYYDGCDGWSDILQYAAGRRASTTTMTGTTSRSESMRTSVSTTKASTPTATAIASNKDTSWKTSVDRATLGRGSESKRRHDSSSPEIVVRSTSVSKQKAKLIDDGMAPTRPRKKRKLGTVNESSEVEDERGRTKKIEAAKIVKYKAEESTEDEVEIVSVKHAKSPSPQRQHVNGVTRAGRVSSNFQYLPPI